MTRRIEARPSTDLSPIERTKGWGGRIPKRRHHVIDLSATGEGQGTDTTAPIDPDKLIATINKLAELGRRAQSGHRH